MDGEQGSGHYLDRSNRLLWRTTGDAGRGTRPELSLDAIVTAAVTVADRDGSAALSMRAVARELGVGTMSLYRYVPGKAELLDLMIDRVSDPREEIRQAQGTDWRGALEVIARHSRALCLRHPWLLQVNTARPVFGPHTVAGFEHLISKISSSGLTSRECVEAASMLDGYVTGMARQEIRYQHVEQETGVSHDDFWAHQGPLLERLMATGQYPALAALAEGAFDAGWDETFEFGLQRMLDGLGLLVAARAGSA